MGFVSYDAPQWLTRSFVRAARGAGATSTDDTIEEVAGHLIDRWNGPERHFHNLKHLVMVLHRVDELAQETHEPDLVRLAAWYHGAVFSPERRVARVLGARPSSTAEGKVSEGGEQSSKSASLARAELMSIGVPETKAVRVASLVEGMLRHAPDPKDVDSQVLNDADLGMLSLEPQLYKTYALGVRAEYKHISPADYLQTRITILEKLLARPHLYWSPVSASWEAAARQNIEAELAKLKAEQATMTRGKGLSARIGAV
ncbi:MAG: hypothetical protein LBB54_05530 [Cellulomonadaceae bacterium]|jgi:predicted metal-dependent HD superfamily phosphohydrolase|nr:hypothetical protein [Cellulomonadaceae bacterium]